VPVPVRSRKDVTRGEFNDLIDTLNERSAILNALRDSMHRLEEMGAIQFRRIAQLQAELDGIKRAWESG